MAKWIFFLFFSMFTVTFLHAQQKLEVQGSAGKLYLNHTVAPKETFYSIGRLYNVAPRELASFNKLQMADGLQVAQMIQVPLDKNNFSQSEEKSVLDYLVPVYHTVAGGETLYRLGVNYNNVPLNSLKKWNHLNSDAVSVGTQMIVGYLRVDKNQSAFAGGKVPEPVVNAPAPVQKEVIVQNTETSETAAKSTNNAAAATPVEQEPRATAPVLTSSTEGSNPKTHFNGGIFRTIFDQETPGKNFETVSGPGSVFKSTSGWQDGKYYCFNNEAAPGTIVKVTDNSSGKSVYAKVLDAIPDIKQNAGLSIIISNAAAEELGTGEAKFDCTVRFIKP